MSNIDKRALREAAEKATKGEWAVEFDDEIYSSDGVNHEQIAMVFSENEVRDAAFIAAANPITVLALLDELEKAKSLIEQYDAENTKMGNDIMKKIVMETGLRQQIKRLEHQISEMEAAEKRIADYHRALNNLAAVARRYLPDYDEHPEIQAADDLLGSVAASVRGRDARNRRAN